MGKCQSLIAGLILCVLLTAPSPANSQADPPDDGTAGVTISLLERKLTDTMLQLRYQIRNESDTDEGKCHYAMNPSCRYDSPADMVLLFEMRAGWNQQGGPELFTWKNHDPRGGCVLLNDGTVRFVRTKDELRRLRWK